MAVRRFMSGALSETDCEATALMITDLGNLLSGAATFRSYERSVVLDTDVVSGFTTSHAALVGLAIRS
jgi:hypothetical protein